MPDRRPNSRFVVYTFHHTDVVNAGGREILPGQFADTYPYRREWQPVDTELTVNWEADLRRTGPDNKAETLCLAPSKSGVVKIFNLGPQKLYALKASNGKYYLRWYYLHW
jgi:hypothetical protein